VYFLIGVMAGLAVNLLLKASGLSWLSWPAAGLLFLAAVTLSLVKSGWLRKRS
jgi:hypothetical protein